ncbi:peroxiredoxin [Thalassospira marina]|uniref:Peroxiredoxin n=1 Tax=Thalassospira marina TaxID=2048283 RepID=A0ABM6QGW9_9PROT|nr:peroxiredoxin [Thalassospira marina]AUG55805.1 peroxiredoxin [Thalassospira marina]
MTSPDISAQTKAPGALHADDCAHLLNAALPAITLPATDGTLFDFAARRDGWLIVYCYPRTSAPDSPSPTDWDVIPGARGCTPQSCAFRDHYRELQQKGADVVGLSTQSTTYQQEMVARLHLPFPVLSDADLALVTALKLPVFTVEGMVLTRRLTLAIRDGVIRHVFYPIENPAGHAEDVLTWLDQSGD